MTITELPPVDLATPTGVMRAHLLRPAGPSEARHPALVFFSEIFQITPPIRRTAAILAGHGYLVAVPEIFHELEAGPDVVLPYTTEGTARGNGHKTTKELSSYDADAKAAVEFLRMHPNSNGKVGTFGVCIGGHLAFRAAATNPSVGAAACFYPTDIHKRSLAKGMNDNTLDLIPQIQAELLMVFGRQDPHVPVEGRRVIYEALTAADRNFTWHEFNAQHAFLRDEGPRYDPAVARLAYSLAIDLFSRNL